ncbi:MAG: DUF5666 domain-containing protein [Betaproteobacteria bacterium]
MLWLTILLSVSALIVAGALGAAVRTGGTGLYFAFGVIEDFGSIVVSGVHYDESRANIIVNGVAHQPRSALKLGMVVAIEGELDYALGSGTASVVRADRALLGQVEDVNVATGEVRILAQRVAFDAATRYDGFSGIAQLAVGDWIAVHGLDDPARNLFAATLIELVAPPGAALAEIRGAASNAHDGRFRIDGLEVLSQEIHVSSGDFVAVKGIYDDRARSLRATEVIVTAEVDIHENAETEIEGFIADFRSRGEFTVAGVAIDASTAQIEGGTMNDLKPGVRVTVEGTVLNGVLIAEEIELKDARTNSTTPRTSFIELEGVVSAFNSLGDFVVKGRRIDASGASISIKGNRLPAVGQKAHIKGQRLTDGSIKATRVEFEKP